MLLNTRPCSTCARPVDGALGIVGGAMVHGADEGLLIEIGRHVAVWRQGRLELGIHLSRVAGVRAVKPCRHEKHNQTCSFFLVKITKTDQHLWPLQRFFYLILLLFTVLNSETHRELRKMETGIL